MKQILFNQDKSKCTSTGASVMEVTMNNSPHLEGPDGDWVMLEDSVVISPVFPFLFLCHALALHVLSLHPSVSEFPELCVPPPVLI